MFKFLFVTKVKLGDNVRCAQLIREFHSLLTLEAYYDAWLVVQFNVEMVWLIQRTVISIFLEILRVETNSAQE
jgi:hypothetical protein